MLLLFNFYFGTFFVYTFFRTVVSSVTWEYRDGPSFLHEPPSVVTFLNDSGTIIPCSGNGKPLPKATWRLKDGDSQAFEIPGLRHIRSDGSIAFLAFGADQYRQDIHATIYRCQLTNVVGAILSRDVHVRAVVLEDYKPRVINEYVIPGNTGVLKCKVPNSIREFISFTGWRRQDGTLLTTLNSGHHETSRDKYAVLPTGELYIFNVTPEDSQTSYRCQTKNHLEKGSTLSSASARLIVYDLLVESPAKITDSQATVKVREGESVTLPCTGQGNPKISYNWFREKNGRLSPLVNGHRISVTYGLLKLLYVTVADSGKYICKVNNSKSEDSATTNLIVSAPPSAYIGLNVTSGVVGKSVGINCSVAGHPLTEVQWLKDGRRIVGDGRIVFLGRDILHISSVKREDQGMYQCFAIGEHESAQSSTELRLRDIEPTLVSTFADELVHPESSVSLRCVAQGNPLPQVTWLASDGLKIPDTTRIRLGDYVTGGTQVVSYVNISDVKVQDGGDYSCLAKNTLGSVKHTGRLNVFGPPHIRAMKNKSAIAGDNITLQCPVAGYPIESIMWYKEGVVLPINHRQTLQSMGKLFINNLERSIDQGEYSCLARNAEGQEAKTNFYLYINMAPLIDIQALPPKLFTVEGNRFKLLCSVLEGDPEIHVEWRKNGHPLQRSDGISLQKLDDSLLLQFGKVTFMDKGNYTCVASNNAATISRTTEVIVRVPPNWLQEPSEGSVVLGDRMTLNCLASGYPEPNITWKKSVGQVEQFEPLQFETISSSFRRQIFKNGTLQVQDVSLSDSAHYLCQATNGVGAGLSRVIPVKVHVPPKFQERFQSQNVRKGDRATLRCQASGEQPILIKWEKEKQQLLTLSHKRLEIQARADDRDRVTSELQIISSERSDSGLYTCIASNNYGQDETSIQLVVQELPSEPLGVVIKRKTARSVTLEWLAPFNGNSPITRYVVQFRNGTASWQGDNVVSATDKEVIVQGLIPATKYYFRVLAGNSVGLGPASKPILCKTDEEAPGGPPMDIIVEATGAQSVKVQWKPPRIDLQYGDIKGYYIGYKEEQVDSYQYKNVETLNLTDHQTAYLTNLNRNTRYGVMVQAYNSMGAGPRSDEVFVTTLEAAPPTSPVIMVMNQTPTSIKIHWERRQGDSALKDYVLHYKGDDEEWHQEKFTTDMDTYELKKLRCGSTYRLRMTASNSLGTGEARDIITARTKGAAPGTPSKEAFIAVNSTFITLYLTAWRAEFCPIEKFKIQYKLKTGIHWKSVQERLPNLNERVVVQQLLPNREYSLMVSAVSQAGTTEAEFSFKTLPLMEKIDLSPAIMSSDGVLAILPFYRNLAILLPLVISAFVLLTLVISVLFCLKRHGDTGSAIASNRDEGPYDEITIKERVGRDGDATSMSLHEYPPLKLDKLHPDHDAFSKSSYYASPTRKAIPITRKRAGSTKDEAHEYAEPYSAIQSARASYPNTISEFEYSTNIKNEGPYATIKRSPPRPGDQFLPPSQGDKASKLGPSVALRSNQLAYSSSTQSGSSSLSSDIYKCYPRSEIS